MCHGCSTRKTLWEEKFTLANTTSCGRRNVWKHRDINNCDQYIILGIYSKLDCLEKREVTSLESKDYIERPGKGLTISLDLSKMTGKE